MCIVLLLNAVAWAESPEQPIEGSSPESATADAAVATPSASTTTEDTAPAEFPGVVQGGVVSAPRSPSARPWPTQRNFALFATEGSYSGFGLGLRGGWLRVGMDASFAYFPILATYSWDPESFPEFKLLSSLQGNATIYVGLYRPDPRTDLGIAFGYKYNSLLRHGVNVAFYLQRELSAHFTLQAFVGPTIFPAAEDQIRDKTGWKDGSVLSGMAWHQAGLGLSLAYFP
jgi:hypothetical protein